MRRDVTREKRPGGVAPLGPLHCFMWLLRSNPIENCSLGSAADEQVIDPVNKRFVCFSVEVYVTARLRLR